MNLLPYLVGRMREASSYAGLVGMLLGASHIAASPDLVNAALGLVAALGGLLAVLIPEKSAAAALARAFLPLAVIGPLAVGLGACAGQAPTAATPSSGAAGNAAAVQPLQGLASFVTTDLQNAVSIAKANNDTEAAQCYSYLIPQVAAAQQQLGTLAPADISGGFSAFEAGRVAVNNAKVLVNGVPQGLNEACAPLVVDASGTLVALAAKVGVTIALPASLPLAALP
jgi:hypothetical protein